MQDKLDSFAQIISKSGLTIKQKEYCVNVLNALCFELAKKEKIIERLRATAYGLKNPEAVDDYVNKHIAIVNLSADKYRIDGLNPDNYGFIMAHKEELKDRSIDAILKTADAFNLFKQLHDKEPSNINELRQFLIDVTSQTA